MLLVKIFYIPRTRPVAYCLSAADLACPLAEELIRTWLLAKTKKKMEWSNSRISYTICGKYDRHTYITMWHICDVQFSYNPKKHPKQKKKLPSEKAFLTTPICCGFWSHQKNWLSWALHPCWQAEWCQSRVYVRTLQVFCFCFTHLDHFRRCKTKTTRRKGI